MTQTANAIARLMFPVLLLIAASSHASPNSWQLSAQFDDTLGTDTLGIDGNTLLIDLAFDTTQNWGTNFAIPAVTASAQISGHMVSLVTATPAMTHPFGMTTLTIVAESDSLPNAADLIIDGTLATMGGFQGLSVLAPVAMQTLTADHLMSSFNTLVTQITGTAPNGTFSYSLLNRNISISTAHVPLAPTLALMLIGGAGLVRQKSTLHS